jgi:hypothetical protein
MPALRTRPVLQCVCHTHTKHRFGLTMAVWFGRNNYDISASSRSATVLWEAIPQGTKMSNPYERFLKHKSLGVRRMRRAENNSETCFISTHPAETTIS